METPHAIGIIGGQSIRYEAGLAADT